MIDYDKLRTDFGLDRPNMSEQDKRTANFLVVVAIQFALWHIEDSRFNMWLADARTLDLTGGRDSFNSAVIDRNDTVPAASSRYEYLGPAASNVPRVLYYGPRLDKNTDSSKSKVWTPDYPLEQGSMWPNRNIDGGDNQNSAFWTWDDPDGEPKLTNTNEVFQRPKNPD